MRSAHAAKVDFIAQARPYFDKTLDQGRKSCFTVRIILNSPLLRLADPGAAVVSQATHICDLARYLSPPPIIDSLHVHTVEHSDPAGKVSLDWDEKGLIRPENRIPRITNAIWRCEGGSTGHLLHGVALAGEFFSVYDKRKGSDFSRGGLRLRARRPRRWMEAPAGRSLRCFAETLRPTTRLNRRE